MAAAANIIIAKQLQECFNALEMGVHKNAVCTPELREEVRNTLQQINDLLNRLDVGRKISEDKTRKKRAAIRKYSDQIKEVIELIRNELNYCFCYFFQNWLLMFHRIWEGYMPMMDSKSEFSKGDDENIEVTHWQALMTFLQQTYKKGITH